MKKLFKPLFLILGFLSLTAITPFIGLTKPAKAATMSMVGNGITVTVTVPDTVSKDREFDFTISIKNNSRSDVNSSYALREVVGPYSKWMINAFMKCAPNGDGTCNSSGQLAYSFNMPSIGASRTYTFPFTVEKDADPELIVRPDLFQISKNNSNDPLIFENYIGASILDGKLENVTVSSKKISAVIRNGYLVTAFRGNDNRLHSRIADTIGTRSSGWYSAGLPLYYTYTGETQLIYFNNSFVQAAKTSANTIVTRAHSNGINTPSVTGTGYAQYYWNQWISNGSTPGEISMEVFNGRIYQAVRGSNPLPGFSTPPIYTRYSTDGLSWSQWVADGRTPGNVTMKVFNGRLYQSTRGGGNVIYTRYTNNGTDWYPWTANGTTPNDITMEVFGGKLYQSVKGNSSTTIYTRYTVNGSDWYAWSAGGTTQGNIDMEVVGNRLYQSARTADNKIGTRYTIDGFNWYPWELYSSTNKDITLTSDGSNLYQVYVGTDGKPYERHTWVGGGYSWTTPSKLQW